MTQTITFKTNYLLAFIGFMIWLKAEKTGFFLGFIRTCTGNMSCSLTTVTNNILVFTKISGFHWGYIVFGNFIYNFLDFCVFLDLNIIGILKTNLIEFLKNIVLLGITNHITSTKMIVALVFFYGFCLQYFIIFYFNYRILILNES